VFDLLTSDSVIFVLAALGLVTTAVNILRDTRAERERVGAEVRVDS
jgi:hypothetical protein